MSLLREAQRHIKSQSLNKGLNAFVSTANAEKVLKAAQQADDRHEAGTISPIDGRLIAIKDNVCTKDFPTTCASRILENYTSPFDATIIRKLQGAGAVIAGKTNLDEFGMGSHSTHSHFGPMKNFYKVGGDDELSAGGSSGGSALAVATWQCYAALGTDTGGSVRLPAAYTGIVGFKPSYGRISRWGVIPYANSLDTVGILARSSRSASSLFNCHDPEDPTSLSGATRSRLSSTLAKRNISTSLKVGVPLEYNIQELSPVVRKTWLKTLRHLESQGHSLHSVSLPTTKHALSAYYVLAPAEASSNLAKYDGVRYGVREAGGDRAGGVLFSETRGKGFGAEVKQRILLGAYSLSAQAIDNYFIQAQKVRRRVQQDFDEIFSFRNPLLQLSSHGSNEPRAVSKVDVLVCPTAPTPPPRISDLKDQSSLDAYMNDVLTVPASLAGLPAMSLPVKIQPGENRGSGEVDSVGMQIIAQYGDEESIFRTARCIEEWSPPSERLNVDE
ncbi:MAG: Trimeric GatFAB AmidoTransferase(AdT) complex subunit [Sclerophora amabilis]|nr:MAG: Trimeric GatFAB AmidoTransferase(AdT) complex subunit [Sclerophora amabilis]